ncbi:MAG: bifunctional diaminohydroxyphosphoribosylaminopyrimidine deaminase/5-amino-6-(5-phosphoribosylamino)uracil reductase RibD [Planctomycetota bacterium]
MQSCGNRSRMTAISTDEALLSRAIEIAQLGRGAVEPNPMVGCVIARGGDVVGEGYHKRFGGPHAEVEALSVAGEAANGADVYVTLEPCCHHGKTGPCVEALIQARVKRVIVGCTDPNPKVAGQGLDLLRGAGIEVVTDVLTDEAQRLIAPFSKLITTGRPWVIGKWAMTLDGKIASYTGSSQWISGEASRAAVHQLRGVVDAVLVGRGTVEADDPLLTARPAGPRTATRVVLDSAATLPLSCQLVQSIDQAPLLIAATSQAPSENRRRLEDIGAEVLSLPSGDHKASLVALLDELGTRQMTNLLVEGGGEVLGSLLDLKAIDEVQVFVAPKLIGGACASSPVGGVGIAEMAEALSLDEVQIDQFGADIRVRGLLR